MKDSSPLRASAESTQAVCPACISHVARLAPFAFYAALHGKIAGHLERLSSTVPPLLLRLILAYEFGEAGWMKLRSENWFADLAFPFPFSLLPADINWLLATGFEIAGPIALALGFATRFFSFALMVLTVVAIASVHWPAEWHSLPELWEGYAITDQGHGNYKLPVLYLVMLIPLLFGGAGRLSLDRRLAEWLRGSS